MRVTQFSVLVFFIVSAVCAAKEKPVVVAVIDTGIDAGLPNLCKFGHKSFADSNPLSDSNGHGTHVAGLINRFSKNTPHCLVSIKFYSENGSNVETMLQSIQYAINIKADVINISAGGTWPNLTEKLLIKRALDMGIKVVAAAGNEASNLDIQCSFFPACYDRRVVSVGNLEERSQPLWEGVAEAYLTYPAKLSNYGTYVSRWEIGSNVTSNLPGGRLGTMSGTSQAAAVATGKIVGEMRRVYAK